MKYPFSIHAHALLVIFLSCCPDFTAVASVRHRSRRATAAHLSPVIDSAHRIQRRQVQRRSGRRLPGSAFSDGVNNISDDFNRYCFVTAKVYILDYRGYFTLLEESANLVVSTAYFPRPIFVFQYLESPNPSTAAA
jgi:hypothetical protein